MITKLILGVYIATVTPTAYQPISTQTDNTPLIAANGKMVHSDGIAVSRDLHERWGGPLKFGDLVYIEGIGYKIVNDVMHERYERRVDILVWTEAEEAEFWKQWKGKTVTLWKVMK